MYQAAFKRSTKSNGLIQTKTHKKCKSQQFYLSLARRAKSQQLTQHQNQGVSHNLSPLETLTETAELPPLGMLMI